MLTSPTGVGAFLLWPVRGICARFAGASSSSLVTLQVFMKAPVWFLMSHLSGVMGGSGWHRAMLIDTFVHRFFDWWIIGSQDNAKWGYDMWDSLNAFVNAGIEGGLITFALFVAVFVYAYKRTGRVRKKLEKAGQRSDARLVWGIGCCVLANNVAFFGITYFDQSIVAWYAVLAIVSVATTFAVAEKPPIPIARGRGGKDSGGDAAANPQRLRTLASVMQ